jgi:hypothetical protein
MQTCNGFIIPKFIEGSTCFERHTAHYQELQTVLAVSGLYTYVVCGRCPAWTTTDHHLGIYTIGCKFSLELLMMIGMPL